MRFIINIMHVAYHSDCCPLMSKKLAQLTLAAYGLYYNARQKEQPPEVITLEGEHYKLLGMLNAKVLPLSRYKPLGMVATKDNEAFVIFRGTESVSEWVGDSRF